MYDHMRQSTKYAKYRSNLMPFFRENFFSPLYCDIILRGQYS